MAMSTGSYHFRRPTQDDFQAVADLVRTVENFDSEDEEDPTEYVKILFRLLDFDQDAWLVEDDEGRAVAVGGVRRRIATRIRAFGGVLPEHRGRGIGTGLLERMEERARKLAADAPEGEEVLMGGDVASGNEGAKQLFEERGYEHARYFWKMGIDLDQETPEPEWPEGIRVEHARRDRDEPAVHAASDEAFQDHWDHHPTPYEEWREWMVDSDWYDPSLWLLAWDGDEIAALSLCSLDPKEGWIGVLGTRRPWRRRGLAKALLYASFNEIRARGKPRAVLGVDAQNPTGATRLYEGAGMRVLSESAAYRLRVR